VLGRNGRSICGPVNLAASKTSLQLLSEEAQRLADATRHASWLASLGCPVDTKELKLLVTHSIERIERHNKDLK
jgi:hypothetical protein